jgi:hypothetical protein
MAFNIQTFADNISTYGNIQTNKFEIRIPVPTLIRERSIQSSVLSLRADRVDMPGILFDSTDVRRYGVGPQIKTPTNATRFNEVTMSFVETGKAEIYTLFNDWLQTIIDFAGSAGSLSRSPTFLTGYKSEYTVDILIKIFNNEGLNRNFQGAPVGPVLELNLVDAFPLSLGDINLSWSNNNELFRTNVVFSYTHHQLVTGTGT